MAEAPQPGSAGPVLTARRGYTMPGAFPLGLVIVWVLAARLLGVQDTVVIPGLINVVLVLGLYVFSGNSGIFSFGHVGLMAVGAYSAAILTIPPATKDILFKMPRILVEAHASPLVATVIAAVTAASVAAAFGLPAMRLSGLSASIATFALLVIIHVVSRNLDAITNGQSGMTAVPVTVTVTWMIITIGVSLVVCYVYQASSPGLRLRASREDEAAAYACGIRIRRERRIAWVIGGGLAGLAGALYAEYFGTFAPDTFYLDQTFLIIAMLVIGGMRSVAGAVVGAIVVTSMYEVLRQFSAGTSLGAVHLPSFAQYSPLLMAGFMLVVLVFRPSGITGGREPVWHIRFLGSRSSSHAP